MMALLRTIERYPVTITIEQISEDKFITTQFDTRVMPDKSYRDEFEFNTVDAAAHKALDILLEYR